MAARTARFAIACWLIAAPTSLALANPFQCLWTGTKKVASDIARDTKRRNCWPEPFVYPDIQSVRAPFGVMIAHGWRQQNLIGDYHFHEGGIGLTEAGRQKIRWILFEAAPQHRAIYVQMADDPNVTAARVAEIQQVAAQLSPYHEPPPVLQTRIQPQGWPAEWVDSVSRKYREATPAPVLPEKSSTEAF